MYRFPADSEFRSFLFQELSSVLVSRHCSVLHFSGGASITIEGSGEVNREHRRLDARGIGREAIKWLGASVTSISRMSDRHLQIRWSNGDELELVDDTDEYETFWFFDEANKKSIVV